MKKKMVLSMLCASMVAAAVAGCGSTENESTTSNEATVASTESNTSSAETEDTASVHTVTYYDSDGETVLKTSEVEDSETADDSAVEKESYTFMGWFVSPLMTREYDFTTPVTSDLDLYAGYTSYVEDTRTFAIVGDGDSVVLAESSWGSVIGDAQMMTKEDVEGANVYTITLDLEEGDQFQFAVDSSWSDQRGYGYLDTIELDGVEYFKNSGGLGETDAKKSNIEVAVAGNYTITLTTYPSEDYYDTEDSYYTEEGKENFNYNPYDTISWVYNGESASE